MQVRVILMIELTTNQIEILGRPNFSCANIAKVLIISGLYENKEETAEYEQAVYIHWASNLLSTYGEQWKEEARRILSGL